MKNTELIYTQKRSDFGKKAAQRELWADVPGYGGHYRVSSNGRVMVRRRTVTRMGRHGRLVAYKYRARLLRPTSTNGYKSVHIGVDGKKICALVHHLVLSAFVAPRPDGLIGCHNDGNPLNNKLINLRWDTHLGNMKDRKDHGRYASGSDHPMSRFTDAERENFSKMSLKEALLAGISKTHFYRLKRRIAND